MSTQATSTNSVHLPVCGRCADAIRDNVGFLADHVGCPCGIVMHDHYHDEPGVFIDVGGKRYYCPPCVCCKTYCVPDAVICADVEDLCGGVVAITSWELAELVPA